MRNLALSNFEIPDVDPSPVRTTGAYGVMYKKFYYSLILFALVSNGIYIHLDGARLTPARIMGALLLVWLFGLAFTRKRISLGGIAGPLIICWLLLSLFIDIIRPGSPLLLKHFINISAGIVWFFIVANCRIDYKRLYSSLTFVGFLLAGLAILALSLKALNLHFLDIPPDLFGLDGGKLRLKLFSWEPNILGGCIAAIMVMLIPAITATRKSWTTKFVFALLFIPLIGALSKGPIIAFCLGLSIYFLLTLSRKAFRIIFSLSALGSIGLLASAFMRPHILSTFLWRQHNFVVRLTHIHYALLDFYRHPLIGNGTFSLSVLWPHLNAQFGTTGAWVGQTVIGVLHDTGLIGVGLFISFILLLITQGIRTLIRARQEGSLPEACRIQVAIISTAFVMFGMGLATTLYSLPVYWAIMGLLANTRKSSRQYYRDPSDAYCC